MGGSDPVTGFEFGNHLQTIFNRAWPVRQQSGQQQVFKICISLPQEVCFEAQVISSNARAKMRTGPAVNSW